MILTIMGIVMVYFFIGLLVTYATAILLRRIPNVSNAESTSILFGLLWPVTIVLVVFVFPFFLIAELGAKK